MPSAASKTDAGNFFEDFTLGRKLVHATPRTLTEGDRALYTALYPARFALQSSDAFAQGCGLPSSPLDDLIVFHTVFGKTVPDVSLNAVANLGYAEGRFLAPVRPGATLRAESEVIGLKENANGETGVVYVRTRGFDQNGATVLEYVRWVMVRKRDKANPAPEAVVPTLARAISAADLAIPAGFKASGYDFALAGAPHRWGDYEIGEKIDHVDGATVEEAEHMLATRLWQNTAKVHFNQHTESKGRFGKRLIYGGHVLSLARALSFNGLANAFQIAAINGGTHVAPLFAGDTVYAWSEVLDKAETSDPGIGALRLRLVAVKNRSAEGFPLRTAEGKYEEGVILDFDYWALTPR
ncbi:MaoC family dehydratase [Neomegalonema sp.]|uniref:MaoC family dehydratase n=1 Tax=Neomegalonema sp. TaxID=2039713 RepID=UPI002605C738|nr:MaoC family dehydratase [Neomegalonema sp.]MDD2867083.1 MaoC family dehydratase [Neomegalonema sp.]